MSKKAIFSLIVLILALAVALFAVSCGGKDGGGNTDNEILPTLTKVKIIPVVNGHNGDEESDVCLEIIGALPEMYNVEITVANPDNYSITSVTMDGVEYGSAKFGAESTNKVIYLNNNSVPKDASEHTVTIEEIRYTDKKGGSGKVALSGNNVKKIRVAPTFTLTLDLTEANQTDVSPIKSVENDYMAPLATPPDENMNAYLAPNALTNVYGYYGYVFDGWYTEPNGKGAKISSNSSYTYYKDITLYAHYARPYAYKIEEGVATVTGITEAGINTSFTIEIPTEIEGAPVRYIAPRAFISVCGGKTVILPNTIMEIGEYAFMGCTDMQIELATTEIIGKMAFADCGKLVLGKDNKLSTQRIGALPSTLREIGDYAFKGCSWDTSILNPYREMYFQQKNALVLPQTLTKIGAYAFAESLFELLYVEDALNLQTLGASTFEGSKSLKNIYTGFAFNQTGNNFTTASTSGLKDISDRMFYGCTSLTSTMASNGVKLGEGLRSIGELAFASSGEGMTKLEYISFPTSLESIGKQAFANTALKNVVFSTESNLVSLGEYAFENSKFEEITLYSLTNYGKAPFWGNTALKAINILTDNVPTYAETDTVWGAGLTRKAKYYVKKDNLSAFRSSASWAEDGASDYVCAYDYITSSTTVGVTLCFEPVDDEGNLDFSSTSARVTAVFDLTREITVPSVFTFEGVNYTVISVGKYFIHDDVTKVYLPSTIKRIEDRAFYTCDVLYEVVWRDGTVNIAKGKNKDIALEYIGADAFYGSAITYFYSNTALKTIGKQAFHNCKNLSLVVCEYGTSLTIMGSAFSQSGLKTLVIGHNVKSIYDSAFQNNTELSLVLINLSAPPPSTEGNYPSISPFRDCSGLNKILLFSNNAMANFTDSDAPNGKNNTYANVKKSDGITSAYEKYAGTWSEAIEYYNIY